MALHSVRTETKDEIQLLILTRLVNLGALMNEI